MSLPFTRPRLTVIGIGYLGLTHAVCMADLGHDVLAIDVDEDKVAAAARGDAPFFEPGLEPLLRKNLDAGRLRFTTSFAAAAAFGEIHFLCVGPPEGEGAPAGPQVDVAWSPEFLREGHAVQDSLTPDRIVLGVTSGRAEERLREVYA